MHIKHNSIRNTRSISILMGVLLVLSSSIFSSCEEEEGDGPIRYGDANNKNMNIAGADKSVSRLEIPHINSQFDYICHRLSNGDVNYTIEYDHGSIHSRWVAYAYDTRSAQQNYAQRSDAWRGEPYYDNNKDYQLSTKTFGSGYARGHIVGSAERYYSEEANKQTYYMSNMSPMMSNFNSTYYGEGLETLIRNWGRGVNNKNHSNYKGTLYVVKGGTLNQTITHLNLNTTNGNTVRVPVPKYYWAACLFVSKEGSARAIGFWMEHKEYKKGVGGYTTPMALATSCAVSIDKLEKLTGLDFFCNLADNVENEIESKFDISRWNGL